MAAAAVSRLPPQFAGATAFGFRFGGSEFSLFTALRVIERAACFFVGALAFFARVALGHRTANGFFATTRSSSLIAPGGVGFGATVATLGLRRCGARGLAAARRVRARRCCSATCSRAIDRTLLADLDGDLFGAAMAEALAHRPGGRCARQCQRLCGRRGVSFCSLPSDMQSSCQS